ncbi:hypothetical protein [Rhodoferax antarcticus]|uniref:hypothetical protein n=1 Tax=Rhodoferax antarcticus TaxID=81479 RepID=UPI002225731F|nr:hypothetical protein [Rhodoferax antarcticus]MCW2313680.1 hypothetical protein [Rhodoferax antarcticus]
MSTHQRAWAVVIFACRESLPQLQQTLDATLVSGASCAVIHVLVNGNPALGKALVTELDRRDITQPKLAASPAVQVWSIPMGDKANAWNQYIHRIWAGEAIAFFIDGYVRLNPDAIGLLSRAVIANTRALGGTGVPTMGRSAKALRENMIVNTGFHGNFCCIKGETIQQMRDRHIRLPVGLYRTDSLMGAILCFALDPRSHAWEDYRIHVHPEASWQINPARWWHPKDVQAHIKRYFRQIRGKLENAAIADHLDRRLLSPAELPATARQLVLDWAKSCPADYKRLAHKHWLMMPTLESIHPAPVAPLKSSEPELVWQG